MREYIQRLRTKPRRVRERIAIGASLGFTGAIALGWMAVMIVANPLASPRMVSGEAVNLGDAIAETRGGLSNLLGGAAASRATSTEASGIRIIDARPEPSEPEPVVLPF